MFHSRVNESASFGRSTSALSTNLTVPGDSRGSRDISSSPRTSATIVEEQGEATTTRPVKGSDRDSSKIQGKPSMTPSETSVDVKPPSTIAASESTNLKPSQLKGALKSTDGKLSKEAARPSSLAPESTTFKPINLKKSESKSSVDADVRPSSLFVGGSESSPNVKPSQMKGVFGEQGAGNVRPSALKAADSKFGKK